MASMMTSNMEGSLEKQLTSTPVEGTILTYVKCRSHFRNLPSAAANI
jgi:hypothetical protein